MLLLWMTSVYSLGFIHLKDSFLVFWNFRNWLKFNFHKLLKISNLMVRLSFWVPILYIIQNHVVSYISFRVLIHLNKWCHGTKTLSHSWTGLTMLFDACILHQLLVDGFATTVYLVNRMPMPILNSKSPFQCLFHSIPDYSFLKNFGWLCFLFI